LGNRKKREPPFKEHLGVGATIAKATAKKARGRTYPSVPAPQLTRRKGGGTHRKKNGGKDRKGGQKKIKDKKT